MDNTFHNAFSPIKNIKSVKQYEQEIDQLRNENFNLKSKIAYLGQSAPTTQQPENFLHDAQLSLNILKDENKTLKEENEILKKKICEDECIDLKEENLKIVKCVESLNKQHTEEKEKMTNEKNMLISEMCELKKKFELEINKIYNEKHEMQNKLSCELNKNLEKQKIQETEIIKLMNELENAKSYYNAEMQRISSEVAQKYEIEIEKYKNALEKAKTIENELKIQLMEHNKNNNRNIQENDESKSKLYNEKLKKMQEYINAIKQKNKDYEKQINEGNKKYDTLQIENRQLYDKSEMLEKEVEKVKNEYESLEKRFKYQNIENKENHNEMEYLNHKKEICKLNDKIKELRIRQTELENEIASKNKEIETVKNDCEKQKLANHELEKLKLVSDEYERLKLNNNDLNKKIKTLQKDIIKLENEKSDLSIFNDELKNKLRLQFVEIRNIEKRMKNKEFLIKVLEEKNKNFEIREEENIKNSFEVSNLYKSNSKDRIKLLENEIMLLRQNGTKVRHEMEIEKLMKKETNERLLIFVNSIEKIRENIEKLKNKIKRNEKTTASGLERYKQKINELQKKCRKESKKIIEPLNLIDKKNQDFIKKNFSGLSDLNEIIKNFASVYKTLNHKIDILERENSQITSFVENNNNKKTVELLEAFNNEFCSAKAELEFCKEYLKKKGNEIREMRNINKIYQNKIQEYEEQHKKEKNNVQFFGSKPHFAI